MLDSNCYMGGLQGQGGFWSLRIPGKVNCNWFRMYPMDGSERVPEWISLVFRQLERIKGWMTERSNHSQHELIAILE